MQGLISSRDSEIRPRILMRFEQDLKLTLQVVVDEHNWIISIRQDPTKIEKTNPKKQKLYLLIMSKLRRLRKITKPTPCHSCVELHLKNDCPFKG